MTNKLEWCKHRQLKEQDWFIVVHNPTTDQVCIRIQDLIKQCFYMKCEKYDECPVHEEVAEKLLWNFTDFRK